MTLSNNKLRQAAPFTPRLALQQTQQGGNQVAPQAGTQQVGIPAGAAAGLVAPTLQGTVRPNAVLHPSPATIHQLWEEYQHGISGNIPAKDFRPRERGRCKFTYSRRNKVWQIICDLVRAGIDADVVCDRFYLAYGANKSVTTIINCVYAQARGKGGEEAKHPLLRVGHGNN